MPASMPAIIISQPSKEGPRFPDEDTNSERSLVQPRQQHTEGDKTGIQTHSELIPEPKPFPRCTLELYTDLTSHLGNTLIKLSHR